MNKVCDRSDLYFVCNLLFCIDIEYRTSKYVRELFVQFKEHHRLGYVGNAQFRLDSKIEERDSEENS